MKLSARVCVLCIIAIFSAYLLITACAPSEITSHANTSEPAPSTTATPTVIPTMMPLITSSPIPTAVPLFSEERTIELNQQIQDFLNKTREYAPETISSMMIKTISNLDESKIGLGSADGRALIEGYFFDYFEKDNSVFLLMGFDGSDGNRFITLVDIPFYYFENVERAVFSVCKNNENHIYSTYQESKGYKDINSLQPVLNEVRNRVIAILLAEWSFDWSTVDKSKFSSEFIDYTINELNPKASLVFGLLHLVTSNGFEIPEADEHESSHIIYINCVEDLYNIDLTRVPSILAMIYFENPI